MKSSKNVIDAANERIIGRLIESIDRLNCANRCCTHATSGEVVLPRKRAGRATRRGLNDATDRIGRKVGPLNELQIP